MKTLFISDLDGTLLNANAEISPRTAAAVNRFTARGGFFTVATARTAATVRPMLSALRLNAPAILMNGAAVYDFSLHGFALVRYIEPGAAAYLAAEAEALGLSGFLYKIESGEQTAYYSRLDTPQSREFMESRVRKFNKKFVRVPSLSLLSPEHTVSFCACEAAGLLLPFRDRLIASGGLSAVLHGDIYGGALAYLDVCSPLTSKRSALDWLKSGYGFTRVVAFGDNLNDLPLFDGSDERIAVANAVPELRAKADRVIGANTEDGVAEFLEGLMKL